MANVVRLVNGGSIQVRTGVIQGIGPQGPRGVAGETGSQGEQGPTGDPGPMGQILQLSGTTKVANSNPIAANTDTAISFGSNQLYDTISNPPASGFSLGAFTIGASGDYLLSCWLRFDDAAASAREIWFQTGSTMIARKSAYAGVGAPFYTDLAFPFHSENGGEVINVLVRSGAATGVGEGAWTVTRIGSGPPGPIGPKGETGGVGGQGIQGQKGDPGSANSGFIKYADLLPH